MVSVSGRGSVAGQVYCVVRASARPAASVTAMGRRRVASHVNIVVTPRKSAWLASRLWPSKTWLAMSLPSAEGALAPVVPRPMAAPVSAWYW